MDDHPGVGMMLEDVARTLARFGMIIPPDLVRQLIADAAQWGTDSVASIIGGLRTNGRIDPISQTAQPNCQSRPARVVRWQSAL